MGKEETIILIFASFAAILLLAVSFIIILVLHRNRKMKHSTETKFMQQLYEQQLLQAQLDTQQQTMQHIGQEIHDNVGQKLTLASLYAKQLSTGSAVDMEKKVMSVGNIIDESLAELRQLSKTLTNPELANAGLFYLLDEEAKRINVSGICHVSINNSIDDIVLSQAEKNIIFRLLQEFIQNSLKHSGCRKIVITLTKRDDKLLITSTDDGKGFDTSIVSNGIGLQNMKRRAEQLNAVYNLNSEVGNGTTLTLQLPLSK